MSELDIIGRAFDERAGTYDESAMHRHVAEAVAVFVDLSGVDEVLDVATGTGLVLRALRARSRHLSLTGIDLSPAMLAVAAKALHGAELIEGDAAALPLHTDSVDLVTCATALHIIPDVPAALSEWRRVLRPGGRAVTATFSTTDGAVSENASAGGGTRPYPRRHTPFRSIEVLSRTASSQGFEVTRSTNWTDGTDSVLIAEWSLVH